MLSLAKLPTAVKEALVYVTALPDVADAEMFALADGNLPVRLRDRPELFHQISGKYQEKILMAYGFPKADK